MASLSVQTLLVLLVFVTASYCMIEEASAIEGQREFDYFALSLQWPGTYCRHTRHCCSQNACCRGYFRPALLFWLLITFPILNLTVSDSIKFVWFSLCLLEFFYSIFFYFFVYVMERKPGSGTNIASVVCLCFFLCPAQMLRLNLQSVSRILYVTNLNLVNLRTKKAGGWVSFFTCIFGTWLLSC